MVYSKVLNWGISSAGWFCSDIAAYCGGKVFLERSYELLSLSSLSHLLKQKLQTQSLALKST